MDLMNLFLLFSFGICLTGAQNVTITVTPLSATSFNVNWTMIDSQNYTVTWTNLRTDVMDSVTVNNTSYTVTGLSGMDNYNVTVTANGIAMSKPNTVYGPPAAAPGSITFPNTSITSESCIVQWNIVTDLFSINYTVRWYRGDNLIGMASVDGLSYTVTGLTANTSYNVTVVAVSTCCGEGPASNFKMVMTNDEPPTMPTPTNTTTVTATLSASPTSTPGGDSGAYRTSQSNVVIAVTACVITFIMTLIAA